MESLSTTETAISKNIPQLRFPEFEAEWGKSKISKIAAIKSGDTPKRSNELFWNGKIPWISTSLINSNEISFADEHISDEGLKNSSAKLFPKGSILMAMYGQGKTRGKVGMLAIEASTNQACCAIIPKKSINNFFLFQNLVRRYYEIRRLSNEGGQKNLSSGIIKSIKVYFLQLPEQQKIANFLTQVDQKIKLLDKQQTALEQYKKGMMQKIFNQEIRFKIENEAGKLVDPPDWEEKNLGEVCIIKKGEQLNKSDLTEEGSFPCVNGGVFESGFTEKYNTKGETITISEGGNSCGYVNFIKENFWCGGHCYAITEVNDHILNDFLFQNLKQAEIKIMSLRVGSGLPNIQRKDIMRFKVKLPSLKEQTKIANFLRAIDTKIEAVAEHSQSHRKWKKGLLQKMFV